MPGTRHIQVRPGATDGRMHVKRSAPPRHMLVDTRTLPAWYPPGEDDGDNVDDVAPPIRGRCCFRASRLVCHEKVITYDEFHQHS